eukprot:SAG11_NODE_3021_length_2757_cov_2.291196_4_plen_62_part_00
MLSAEAAPYTFTCELRDVRVQDALLAVRAPATRRWNSAIFSVWCIGMEIVVAVWAGCAGTG